MDQHERIRTSAILTQSDVAHLVGITPLQVQRWSSTRPKRGSLITQAPPGYGRKPPTIPLIGLSEATILQELSGRGFSPRALGRIMSEERAADPLAFAKSDLYTDGTDFFRKVLDNLIRTKDGQFAIPEVLGDFVRRVHFDADGIMESFQVNDDEGPPIIIDPRYSAGRPILAGSGAPVFAILGAVNAGENWRDIEEDFGVSLDEVRYVADHREFLAPVA